MRTAPTAVLTLAALLLLTAATRTRAQDVGFRSLVEGSALEHWRMVEGNAGHWRAVNGMIDYDGKSEATARVDRDLFTKQWFRNFVFTFEWRFPGPMVMKSHRVTLPDGGFALEPDGSWTLEEKPSAGDSGVYLRGWDKLQVNLWCHAMGSGQLYGFQHDMRVPVETRRACVPIHNTDRPPGEWNTMTITMIDNQVTIVQNGAIIIDDVELPGLPYGGPIGLQHHNDPVQFRNLRIREL